MSSRDPVQMIRFGPGRRYAVISWQVIGAPPTLTVAEREVALAVAAGVSNREIAIARGTSERTVANQLAAIYRKLSITSRSELVAVLS